MTSPQLQFGTVSGSIFVQVLHWQSQDSPYCTGLHFISGIFDKIRAKLEVECDGFLGITCWWLMSPGQHRTTVYYLCKTTASGSGRVKRFYRKSNWKIVTKILVSAKSEKTRKNLRLYNLSLFRLLCLHCSPKATAKGGGSLLGLLMWHLD